MSILFMLLFNFLIATKTVDKMYCDIKGNVKNPGVYEVIDGDVIYDVIEKAGGLKKNSYVKNINLSKRVTDEMVINILSIDEYNDLTYKCPICECEEVKCDYVTTTKDIEPTSTFKTTISTTEKVITTTFAVTERNTTILTTTTVPITTTSNVTDLININTATIEELMNLSGIGETIANRIIEYRETNPFLTIDDIKNVKGIGEKLFESIKEYISV